MTTWATTRMGPSGHAGARPPPVRRHRGVTTNLRHLRCSHPLSDLRLSLSECCAPSECRDCSRYDGILELLSPARIGHVLTVSFLLPESVGM